MSEELTSAQLLVYASMQRDRATRAREAAERAERREDWTSRNEFLHAAGDAEIHATRYAAVAEMLDDLTAQVAAIDDLPCPDCDALTDKLHAQTERAEAAEALLKEREQEIATLKEGRCDSLNPINHAGGAYGPERAEDARGTSV
jgi:hypothetical protein